MQKIPLTSSLTTSTGNITNETCTQYATGKDLVTITIKMTMIKMYIRKIMYSEISYQFFVDDSSVLDNTVKLMFNYYWWKPSFKLFTWKEVFQVQ